MAINIQLRNGTAAQWIVANPILMIGEMGIENDTYKFKIGNGVANWNSLSYANTLISTSFANTALTADSASYSVTAEVSSYSLTSDFAFTSSYLLPASYNITSSWAINSLTASSINFTASNAILARTASYYNGSVSSASYANSASYAPTNTNITASWSNNSQTASYAITSNNSVSSSYATTASYVLNGASTSGFATTGSNIFTGNQTINGSISASNGITGSLQGTSSYSLTTLTASYALTASRASNADTATNVSGGTVSVLNITASNISASNYYGFNATFNSITSSGPVSVSGSNAYLQLLPVGAVAIPNNTTASYIYCSGSTNDLYFTQYNGDFTNTTRLRWIEGNMYTGLLHGGLITSATGSTTFNLSSGSGIIVNLNATTATDPYPTIKFINWNNFTNQPLTYRTSSIQTFIGIDENASIVQQPIAFNDGDYNNFITIGTVIHQNYSTVNASITYPNVAYGYKQRSYDFIKAFGGLKLSGYELAVSSSSTGSLIIGAGNAWADGRNYQNNPNSPSYITDVGTSVSKIFRYYVSASVDYQDTNLGAGYESIDPVRYNNNGVLTTVTGNNVNNYRWTIQRVFWYPNSATKGIVVYYGNAEYLTQADAIANISYEKFVETQNTKANAIFIGWIIARKDCNFTNSSTFKILQGGLFRSVGGSGGGGSVNLTLEGLSDVLLVNTQDKELLMYDSSSAKWINTQNITASLHGTASNSISSSYSLTASYALTSSYALTASYVNTSQTASYYNGTVISSSYASTSSNSNQSVSASYSLSSSYAPTNTNITASWSLNSTTASYVILAQTASYYNGSVTSASYANSASYAPTNSNLTASYAILASVSSSLNFTDDVAAAAGGVPLGGLYRNGNFILIRLS